MPSYKAGMTLEQAQTLTATLTERFIQWGARKVEVSGSIRRGEQQIGDIDLIVDSDILVLARAISTSFKEKGTQRVTMIYNGQQINLFHASESNWGAMQMYLTGPKGYTIGYRMRAKSLGMKLDQHGLWKDGKVIAAKTEQEIYQALGKQYKEPQDRGR